MYILENQFYLYRHSAKNGVSPYLCYVLRLLALIPRWCYLYIMTMHLKIDALELHTFGKDLKKFPKYIRPAVAALINKLCFNIRTESLKEIHSTMTVRNARFVAGRLRYIKALPQSPVGRQFGQIGRANV